MGLLDISLTSSMRSTLFSLKDTSAKIERAQERLATGKKVMTALDNPTNYFAAQAHLNRAGDLTTRKDGIMEAIKNGDAANVGLKSLVSLLETAKGIANSAHMAGASDRASLASQFNQILNQMDTLAGDSGYRGTNLLKNNDLTVNFNENGSSNLTINGVDATSSGLGISQPYIEVGTHSANAEAVLGINTNGGVALLSGNPIFSTIPEEAQSGVVSISTGLEYALALNASGKVIAWGDNSHGNTSVPVSAQSDVTAISAGAGPSLALKSDGSVVAWGLDNYGQASVPVAAQSGVVAISAGFTHSLALKDDGSVVAWGDNSRGQTTVPIAAQSGVVAIAAGWDHSVALKNDGSVVAWGFDSVFYPVPVEAQSGVVAIAAGQHYSVALKSDGTVVAWGDNSMGQTSLPATVQSGVTAISAGAGSLGGVVQKDDGSLIAWGFYADSMGDGDLKNTWSTDAGISKSEQQLENALSTLRTDAQTLSSNLSVVAVRKEFTDSMVANLQTGADNLTLADMNEEGANMLMLQTRQNLGITSLSMAGQTAQSVMKLF